MPPPRHTDSHSVTHTHTHSRVFPPLFAATGEPSRASQTAPTALCTTLSTVHTLYIPYWPRVREMFPGLRGARRKKGGE